MARLLQAYVRALRDAMFRAIAMCICRGMVTRAGSIDVSIVSGKHKEFRSPGVWPVGLFNLMKIHSFRVTLRAGVIYDSGYDDLAKHQR